MKEEEIKVIEYTIDDSGYLGVHAMSLVENPAIEVDFVALSKTRKVQQAYSKETINKIAQEYLKRNMHHNSNLEHQIPVVGCTVVESWIVEGQHDKSQNFGFSFPEGTWCIGMKIDNDDVWQSIKQGDVKGFSLEGFFTEISDEYMTQQEIEKIMKELENELSGL